MNVYDFDKTVFYPDSSCLFFLYCLKKHPLSVLRHLPGIVSASLRYGLGMIRTKELKETLFAFLRRVPDPEGLVTAFWDAHMPGVAAWYLRQKRSDDLIITASPEFLVGEAGRRLGVRVIGTRMDIRSGRIEGENCHDTEKVKRFRDAFPTELIGEFYSDSRSDAPLAEIAAHPYLVKKGKLSVWS